MGKRRYGGKRKPIDVECANCKERFVWRSDGYAWKGDTSYSIPYGSVVQEEVKFIGKRKEYWEYSTYSLSDYLHHCGGKLKKISISDPMRKVSGREGGHEVLECGHRQWPRSDFFGTTFATKRQCRPCGDALRKEAFKRGEIPFDPKFIKD